MKKLIDTLWYDESAQGTVEYILLLVTIVSASILIKNHICGVVKDQIEEMQKNLANFDAPPPPPQRVVSL